MPKFKKVALVHVEVIPYNDNITMSFQRGELHDGIKRKCENRRQSRRRRDQKRMNNNKSGHSKVIHGTKKARRVFSRVSGASLGKGLQLKTRTRT